MSTGSELPDAVERHLPGETGVWMFIIGDMVIFSLLFSVFVFDRSQEVVLFVEQQRLLNQNFGVTNTLLLLTSSWFVALALHAMRGQDSRTAGRYVASAFACGAGFVVIKYFEWGEKIRAGLTIETNNFFMYYYLMTGIHLLHVFIGLGVLLFLWQMMRRAATSEKDLSLFESCACFWHLVDILWIALFALLYLMR